MLATFDGVQSKCVLDPKTQTARIDYDNQKISADQIMQEIAAKTTYKVSLQ